MADFSLYFELGWQHILDWQGYDHILFVAALCGIYRLADWRSVLILVTAFTIGHTITLALSTLHILHIPAVWIEFLIPLTIICTALANLSNKARQNTHVRYTYAMALGFGLIHGLGFSNYLQSLLGRDTSIAGQLFAFNIGLEFGQILIVLAILSLTQIVIKVIKAPQREWIIFLSAAIFSNALLMTINRLSILINTHA